MLHPITDRSSWLVQRKQLLAKEKEFLLAKDALARERQALPWVLVDKEYVFDTPSGPQSLAQLFEGQSQLLIYHFMFGPNAEVGCKHCSFWADHFDSCLTHFSQRDARLVVVSRGPLDKLEAFKQRLGWEFPWVSSGRTDFNFDFGVSFRDEDRASGAAVYNYAPLSPSRPADLQGFSAFFKDTEGRVYHTYSTFARGIELSNATYQLLDWLPKGRDEQGLVYPMAWVKHHDEYPKTL